MTTVTTISNSTSANALIPTTASQCILLPDNSLILAVNIGSTTTFGGSTMQQSILIQSTNWTSSTPTWSFVYQFSTSANAASSLWWDSTNNRLHVATSSGNGATYLPLVYISAAYSAGRWTWDSAPVTVVSGNVTGVAVICVEPSTQNVYIAYRYYNSGVASIYCAARSGGTWETPFQLGASANTHTQHSATLLRAGSNIVAICYDYVASASGGVVNATIHPDGSNYQTGWGTLTASGQLTGLTAVGNGFGPIAAFANTSSSCWVSVAAFTGGTYSGLTVQQFTFTGTTVSWQSTSVSNLDTTAGSNYSASAGQWTAIDGILYLIYSRASSTSTADVYYTTYSDSAWATTPYNLTNNNANNNSLPLIAQNGTAIAANATIPIVYESGTASPYTISLLTIPIDTRLWSARFRLFSGTDTRSWATRMRLFSGTRNRNFSSRFRLFSGTDTWSWATRMRLFSGTHNRKFSSRFRLFSGTDTRSWASRFILYLPVGGQTYSQPVLPTSQYGGQGVLPVLVPSIYPYAVFVGGTGPGGWGPGSTLTILPTQPFLRSTPASPAGGTRNGILPAGSTFILLWSNPDSVTQGYMANGSTIMLQFALADGSTVQGLVGITSAFLGGGGSGIFQATCTLLTNVSIASGHAKILTMGW
jgi:hypothetical protein